MHGMQMQLCAHAQNVVNNGPMASAAEAVVLCTAARFPSQILQIRSAATDKV